MAVHKTSTRNIEAGLIRRTDDLLFTKETLLNWGMKEEGMLLNAACTILAQVVESLSSKREEKKKEKG